MGRKAMYQEEEAEPEFQISTMVDVLMTLLLFFIATATDEVTTQAADLELPEAPQANDPEDKKGQLVINVEKLTHKLTIDEKVYPDSSSMVPVIVRAKKNYEESGLSNNPFRVLIRADKRVPYSKVKEVMKASAEAGVLDVIFATDPGGDSADGGGGQ
ncbi:MAG: biopolymer transporter ExbD [Verrucomicrobiota bacterium]